MKGALFGCRMCGNCILRETAFVCPMTCPKGLRNGLCGGANPEACEVDPSRPCTWFRIYERSAKMGREDRLLEINAPLDGDRVGRETWLDVFRSWRARKKGPRIRDLVLDRNRFQEEWESLFFDVRQPDWWQGDDQYHPPGYTGPASLLEANLQAGGFVVTGEIAPPLDSSTEGILKKVDLLKGHVVAANLTDNASAVARMWVWSPSCSCRLGTVAVWSWPRTPWEPPVWGSATSCVYRGTITGSAQAPWRSRISSTWMRSSSSGC
jgi:hypothetical protein